MSSISGFSYLSVTPNFNEEEKRASPPKHKPFYYFDADKKTIRVTSPFSRGLASDSFNDFDSAIIECIKSVSNVTGEFLKEDIDKLKEVFLQQAQVTDINLELLIIYVVIGYMYDTHHSQLAHQQQTPSHSRKRLLIEQAILGLCQDVKDHKVPRLQPHQKFKHSLSNALYAKNPFHSLIEVFCFLVSTSQDNKINFAKYFLDFFTSFRDVSQLWSVNEWGFRPQCYLFKALSEASANLEDTAKGLEEKKYFLKLLVELNKRGAIFNYYEDKVIIRAIKSLYLHASASSSSSSSSTKLIQPYLKKAATLIRQKKITNKEKVFLNQALLGESWVTYKDLLYFRSYCFFYAIYLNDFSGATDIYNSWPLSQETKDKNLEHKVNENFVPIQWESLSYSFPDGNKYEFFSDSFEILKKLSPLTDISRNFLENVITPFDWHLIGPASAKKLKDVSNAYDWGSSFQELSFRLYAKAQIDILFSRNSEDVNHERILSFISTCRHFLSDNFPVSSTNTFREILEYAVLSLVRGDYLDSSLECIRFNNSVDLRQPKFIGEFLIALCESSWNGPFSDDFFSQLNDSFDEYLADFLYTVYGSQIPTKSPCICPCVMPNEVKYKPLKAFFEKEFISKVNEKKISYKIEVEFLDKVPVQKVEDDSGKGLQAKSNLKTLQLSQEDPFDYFSQPSKETLAKLGKFPVPTSITGANTIWYDHNSYLHVLLKNFQHQKNFHEALTMLKLLIGNNKVPSKSFVMEKSFIFDVYHYKIVAPSIQDVFVLFAEACPSDESLIEPFISVVGSFFRALSLQVSIVPFFSGDSNSINSDSDNVFLRFILEAAIIQAIILNNDKFAKYLVGLLHSGSNASLFGTNYYAFSTKIPREDGSYEAPDQFFPSLEKENPKAAEIFAKIKKEHATWLRF